MDIPTFSLSPGAIISAHATTLSETMNALLTARAEREQWKLRAEAAEAMLAEASKPAASKRVRGAAA